MAEADAPEGISARPEGQPAPRYAALERALTRHAGRWQGPITATQREIFEASLARLDEGGQDRPLVVDVGCGTGRSTARLLETWPAPTVLLGIDRSAARLGRGPAGEASRELDEDPRASKRLHFARANFEPFFAQLHSAGRRCERVYLLYPNPSPKSGQQSRRAYLRPGFAELLACARSFELRTNWEVYAREAAFVIERLGHEDLRVEPVAPGPPLTDFEAKYRASGHPLWRVTSVGEPG